MYICMYMCVCMCVCVCVCVCVSSGRKLLGVARSGISMLGRANAFANKLGINNPAVNSAVGAIQQYGNPMLNYADNELIGN